MPSRLTRMTHADVPDDSPDPGRARPTRSFAAPTAHGRAHLSYPLVRQPPFSSPQPPPTASQLLTAHCRRAQRKLAAAVPGVVRTSSSCACTQDGASWCRHNTCAAASPGMGRIPRRKPRCALSAAAHHRRRLLSGPTARPFARECTSGPINIMTVPTSSMYWPTTLAAGRLQAAALGNLPPRF